MIIVYQLMYDTIFYMNVQNNTPYTEGIAFDYASGQPSRDQVMAQLAIRISALETHLGIADDVIA